MKNIFLDSDVILDALLKRSDFYLPAANIITLVYEKRLNAVTSSIAFVNIHYFLNKFDKENKMQVLKQLRSFISIANVGETTIDMAINSNFSDFEDAVQFYTAKSVKADFIITRNIKDYKQSSIPVLTPEQFLSTL